MKDQAITNALKAAPGQSFTDSKFSDGGMVLGVDGDHVAISFNYTAYNQNMVVPLQQKDAQALWALLYAAGKRDGWIV